MDLGGREAGEEAVAAEGESLGEGLRAGEDDTSETREGRKDNTYSLFACWQE